jgi:hypothetical protein
VQQQQLLQQVLLEEIQPESCVLWITTTISPVQHWENTVHNNMLHSSIVTYCPAPSKTIWVPWLPLLF